jgi:hypothetical protein
MEETEGDRLVVEALKMEGSQRLRFLPIEKVRMANSGYYNIISNQ